MPKRVETLLGEALDLLEEAERAATEARERVLDGRRSGMTTANEKVRP